MHLMRVLFLCALGTGLVQPVRSDVQPHFQHFTNRQGLSQSTVSCILQDSRGYMWFGTEDGLNRYDGYRFTIYRPEPHQPHTISSNSIWDLMEDSRGDIWIATSNGLNRYDPRLDRFERFLPDPGRPTTIGHSFIRSLLEDRDGTIWAGTHGGGLSRLNRQTGSWTTYRHPPAWTCFRRTAEPTARSS